ncbi:MAG: M56 family metallopeptidase [Bacteroidota bacterium]
MSWLEKITSEAVFHAIGWTIIHSLWQGILVALIAHLIIGKSKDKSSSWKYNVANMGILIVFALAIATFWEYFKAFTRYVENSREMVYSFSDNYMVIVTQFPEKQGLDKLSMIDWVNDHTSLIVWTWMIGVLIFSIRLFGGLWYLQQLKQTSITLWNEKWEKPFKEMTAMLDLAYSIQLKAIAKIKSPFTFGFLNPIIFIPIGLVNQLTPKEIEGILAHELAHIARQDYLWNIIHSFIESLFYFNPGVWWLSQTIRFERENSCDDIAVELCGDSLSYAKTLMKMEEYNMNQVRMAMPFSGNKQTLLDRIKRILNQPQQKSSIMEKIVASVLLIVFAMVFAIKNDARTEDRIIIPESEIATLAPAALDTFPKGTINYDVEKDGERITVKVENQKITYLKVNDRVIPKSEYKNYEDRIEKMIKDVPAPPTPPSPSSPRVPGAPPAPPAPPTPPVPTKKTIKTKKLKNGKTMVEVIDELGRTTKMIVDSESTIVNGDTIVHGEDYIFIKENDGNYFYIPDNFNDIDFDSDEWDSFDFDFEMPEFEFFNEGSFEFPEMDFPTIVMPDMDMDFSEGFYFNDSDIIMGDEPFIYLNNDTIIRPNILELREKMEVLKQEYSQKYRERMELMQKKMLEQQALMEEMHQKLNGEKNRELLEMQMEKLKEMREELYEPIIERTREAYEKRQEEYEVLIDERRRESSFIVDIQDEMLSDGLIESTDNLEFELSDDTFIVNGKKQSNKLKDKYVKLAKEKYKFGKDINKIKIKKTKNRGYKVTTE